ncbi:hypothetical protein WDU99_16830 [Microbacterium sp. Mu-80]|uniref:Uncharacterized protein n=1 Tax=Microbacterium bandirmense TaxID=3122050 RepID=A0ABU8LG61_9MICO
MVAVAFAVEPSVEMSDATGANPPHRRDGHFSRHSATRAADISLLETADLRQATDMSERSLHGGDFN